MSDQGRSSARCEADRPDAKLAHGGGRPAPTGHAPGPFEPVLYDVFYLAALGVLAPRFAYRIAKGKYREGWGQKLGFVPERDEGPRIWIHAVSVGEAVAAGTLAEGLRAELPGQDIVASTVTPTGQEVARRIFGEDATFYLPLDFSGPVRRAVKRLKPTLLILMELELWPNLIAAVRRAGAPVVIVNGRMTERAFSGYRRAQRLLRPTMRRIAAFGCQTEEIAERFRALGAPPTRVHVTGTLKYDGVETAPDPDSAAWARGVLQVRRGGPPGGGERVLLGGSTHGTEELALARAWRALGSGEGSRAGSGSGETWRLVIAPRHPPRVAEVEAELAREGFTTVRRSALDTPADAPVDAPMDARTVIIVDTVGELGRLYHAADLVFMGGSLIPHGGQNPIEPAGVGKPVVFGPHMFNFTETVEALAGAGGAREVASAEELASAVKELASDERARNAMGEAAREAIRSRQGGARRCVELIRGVLGRRDQGSAR